MKPLKEVRFLLLLALALILLPGHVLARPARAQDATPTPTATPLPVGITSPLGGEAAQGVVIISGTSQWAGYQAAEVSFAYADDQTGTWFLIEQLATPIIEGSIATWDTTTISDGLYHLRLQVFLADGTVLERVVQNLRVRNYTAIETSTPPPPDQMTQSVPTMAATPRPTRTPAVDFVIAAQTPEPLPTNPARLTLQRLRESAAVGAGVVAGVLLAAGLYLGMRALFHR